MEHKNIAGLLQSVVNEHGDRTAYRSKIKGEWQGSTWRETHQSIRRVSKALHACGIGHDDKVAILSMTRFEWCLVDLGSVSIGAVTVGIYHTNLAKDCAYIINHSDSKIIFVEDQTQLQKVVEIQAEIPDIERVVIMDGSGDPELGVLSFEEFLALGDGVSDDVILQREQAVKPDDLASLVYTSGTTGVPKGAMITHKNLLFASWSVRQSIGCDVNYETLLFLPLAHVFARMLVYACLRASMCVAFAEDLTKIGDNLREVRPHFIASVPRIFEKVHDKIVNGAEAAGGLKKQIFYWSLGVGYEASKKRQAKESIGGLLALKLKIADKLVLGKIRDALGGRLVYAISGAAPLNKAIAEFFDACGVVILEGIGMTENTSFSNVNRYDNNRFGTVGPPGPGIEQKIAPDGEILFRGDNVMKGYYKNPEATAETITEDGWLLTGDIGVIDKDGFLTITDRKKDLIITAGGKNVAPQRIEKSLRRGRLVSQAVAVGDRKKYIAALITLDAEEVEKWAKEQGIEFTSVETISSHPSLIAEIQNSVNSANQDLASFESVKKFRIVPKDFTIESGELTPTMKVKRKLVQKNYTDLIESMYED